MYTHWQPGAIAMVDFDGGAFHRTQPITLEHVQAVLAPCLRHRRHRDRAAPRHHLDRSPHQATTYRKGRVLLAGDAAHIHSPLGGQGLNLGLGDAMNLGWKLAATIRGDAPAGLLDSYTTERHPVGAQDPRLVARPGRADAAEPASRALEAIIRDLIDTRDGATYFAERVWGVSLRYDLGAHIRWWAAAVLFFAALLPVAASASDTVPGKTTHPVKIGIVGAGQIGGALARHWGAAGHELHDLVAPSRRTPGPREGNRLQRESRHAERGRRVR